MVLCEKQTHASNMSGVSHLLMRIEEQKTCGKRFIRLFQCYENEPTKKNCGQRWARFIILHAMVTRRNTYNGWRQAMTGGEHGESGGYCDDGRRWLPNQILPAMVAERWLPNDAAERCCPTMLAGRLRLCMTAAVYDCCCERLLALLTDCWSESRILRQ